MEFQHQNIVGKVSILILLDYLFLYGLVRKIGLRDDKVSILILLDYLFLSWNIPQESEERFRSLNPYFIGLPILIITGKD